MTKVSGIPDDANNTNKVFNNECEIIVIDDDEDLPPTTKSEIILLSDSEDEVSINVKDVDTNAPSDGESKYLISRKSPLTFDLQDTHSTDDESNSKETKEKKVKAVSDVRTPTSTPSKKRIISSALETHLINPINFKTPDSTPTTIKTVYESPDVSSNNGSSKYNKTSDASTSFTYQELRFKANRCQNCGSREHNESVCENIMYPDNDE
ncbi:336_t:CDS:2, partial [Acaulospora colombiana]